MIMLCIVLLVLLRITYIIGEVVCERDWPRSTWRGLIVAFLLLLCGLSAFGQTASRWDWQAWTINNGNPSPNGLYPVLAIPGATISICSGNPCTLATSYTDSTASTPCDVTTQLTRGTSTACYGIADDQGGFGAWLLPGNYQYTISTNWGTFGPFPFGVDAAGAYCPLAGCVINGNLTVTGTINGIYSCPLTSTVAACVATLPATGGTLALTTGTYQAGSFSSCISTPNVTISGAGTPQYNAGNTALVGGTIIQGLIWFCANNSAAKNLGIDVGSAWVGAGNTPSDGLRFDGPNFGSESPSDPILNGAIIENVVSLGSSPTNLIHAFLVEHYINVTTKNTEGRMAQHCFALKSSKANMDSHRFQGCGVDGIVLKGDQYTQIHDINISNVTGTYVSPGDTNGIEISAQETTGTVRGVSITNYTPNGVIDAVTLINQSGVGAGAVSQITLNGLNINVLSTDGGTAPVCLLGSGASIDALNVDGFTCKVNDPGQIVAPISLNNGVTNSTFSNLLLQNGTFASQIDGTNIAIHGVLDTGAGTSQPTFTAFVGATVLRIDGWSSTRGNLPFSTGAGATAYVLPPSTILNTPDGTNSAFAGSVSATKYAASSASSSDIYNNFTNTGSAGEVISVNAPNFSLFQAVNSSACWFMGEYGSTDFRIESCDSTPTAVVKVTQGAPDSSFTIQSSGQPGFAFLAGGSSGCVQTTAGGFLSNTGTPCAGGGGSGVASIDGQTGAFTFAGAVSHSGNAYTFTGGGSGTVTSFSAGNLSPLFTTSVATSTTTPALTFALSNAAQNSVLAGPPSAGAGAPTYQTAPTISAANMTSFPTLNQNTTGSAAKWTTARNLAGNSVDGSANVAFANKFIVQGTTDAGLSGPQFLGALATGIIKNTTSTGVLSIAVAGDFPTLNQNTTGTAAGLTNCVTSTAGSICYWNGSQWAVLAGNTTTTNWLQETSSGVPSWTTPAGSGTVTHTAGALTALQVVIGNGAADIKVDSGCATDGAGNETCASFATNGTTPGSLDLATGTGSIPALAANSAGFAAPVTGGTSFLYKLPATAVAGILHAAAPGTVDGVNESALTSSGIAIADLTATGTPSSTTFLRGDNTWATPAGSGTVTSIATTSPITGGTITTTGTIACATCVTSAASLTSHAVVVGAGSQASATISADTTTTHALFATATDPAFRAVAATDLPVTPTVVDTSTPVTVSTTNPSEYHFNENATAGTAVTYNLPTAAAGKQFCFSNAYNGTAANTGVLTIATSASGQFIIFTDGTLSATGGNITSGGAAADAACMVGVDATHWMLYVQRGTWTKH